MSFNETIKLRNIQKSVSLCKWNLWKNIQARWASQVESKHMTCGYIVTFLRAMLSATSLTAGIAVVFTLSDFLRKSSAQTNAKNLLGCGSPAETSAKQKHRPRRQPRQPKLLEWKSAILPMKYFWKNKFTGGIIMPKRRRQFRNEWSLSDWKICYLSSENCNGRLSAECWFKLFR